MAASYSKAEDQFRKVMGVFGLAFLIGAVLFAVVPDTIVSIVNWVGGLFSDQSIAPIISKIGADKYWDVFYTGTAEMEIGTKLPSHGMYVTLAVAFMTMLTVICFLIFYDPRAYGSWALLVVIGKLTSSLTGLGFYLWVHPYFANLVVMITDFPIALVVLFFWLRARSSGPPAPTATVGGNL